MLFQYALGDILFRLGNRQPVQFVKRRNNTLTGPGCAGSKRWKRCRAKRPGKRPINDKPHNDFMLRKRSKVISRKFRAKLLYQRFRIMI